ncbi:hypothetical protein BWD42_07415 [Sphingobacterium sp. CZ-UAM]|uniref:SusC/RagA family TonB-linked outer membrane protein n=1 Tax=Sphingobacterium sp. CZ-UAM TaxID=1933868 RepID=UPI000985A1BA|nr:SusC/RagA family TonB-linked outer membrane protein [Sphingobacterium sp. CZ-UAM]OOG19723.1 hypothetical protein BWD42_07415 [Sphingobacterium sp. CZ-UAM]
MNIAFGRSIGKKRHRSHRLLLTIFFLVLFSLPSIAQTISLRMQNAPIQRILQQIRKQVKIDFIGDMQLLQQAPPLSISVNQVDIAHVLLELNNKQDMLVFSFYNNTILFQQKKNSPSNSKVPGPTATAGYSISGLVTDSAGRPLQGASVRTIASPYIGTTTNSHGAFTLHLPAQDNFRVSMLGYEAQIISPGSQQQFRITLRTQHQLISEVKVNTGFTERSLQSMTGASRTIGRKELEQFNNSNIFSVLQSLDPAVHLDPNIFSGSNPNVIPEITIRGTNNVGEYAVNSPLVILDGFEVSLERLYDMDVNRIQSISLLKDVSSTVLYGSRGGNGVIVVETRLPKLGRPSLTYDLRSSLTAVDLADYHLMDAKAKLAYEKLAGLYTVPPGPLPPDKENEEQSRLDQSYTSRQAAVLRGVDTYWLAQPVQTPLSGNHSLRLEGSKSRFRYSLEGYLNETKGVMKASGRKRGGVSLDLIYRLPGTFLLRNKTSYLSTKASYSPYGLFSTYPKMNPYQPLRDATGALIAEYPDETRDNVKFNPLYEASLPYRDDEYSKTLTNNLFLEWQFGRFYTLRSTLVLEKSRTSAYNLSSPLLSRFRKLTANSRGEYVEVAGRDFNYSTIVNLNYARQLGEHHAFSGNMIGELKSADFKQHLHQWVGFAPDARVKAIQDSSMHSNSYSNIVNRLAGLLFTGSYHYRKKYILDLSYRLDGSSKFGANTRYGTFWSAGIGYNIHQEDFFRSDFFQELRFFANTGTNGTDAFLANMTLSSYVQSPQNSYFKEIGLNYHNEGNPDLQWPQIRSWSAGIAGKFWQGRGNFSFAFYRKVTDKMISLISVAPSLGLPNNAYFENMGKVRNIGFESAISLKLFENPSKNMNAYITLTANRNRSKLIDIADALRQLNATNMVLDQDGTYQQTVFYEQGKSIKNLKGVRSLGIDPASGKEIFLDRNGAITDQWNSRDLTVIGNLEPQLFGNLHTVFNYKSLSIQAYFSYRLGNDIYNRTLIDRIENNDPGMNTDLEALQNRWQKPGDLARLKDIKNQQKTLLSSRFVQTEHSLALSTCMLNYDLPKQWIEKWKLQRLRLNLSTNDLFRISTVRMERGLDYPFARTFNMGLTAQF